MINDCTKLNINDYTLYIITHNQVKKVVNKIGVMPQRNAS